MLLNKHFLLLQQLLFLDDDADDADDYYDYCYLYHHQFVFKF